MPPLKLAEAYTPIPVRHHYHHGDETDFQQSSSAQNMGQSAYPSANPTYNPNPTQQTTPMPTPPPSPRPKKQQYQTDQNRPFLFPFSRSQLRPSRGRDARLVPFAIDEADKLYNKHMHISASLLQMWRTREDCMIEESGLQRMPGADAFSETFDSILSLNSTYGLQASGFTSSSVISGSDRKSSIVSIKDDLEDSSEELLDIVLLNAKIAEVEDKIKEATQDNDGSNTRKIKELRERREDLLRLRRVEQIYVSGSSSMFCLAVLVRYRAQPSLLSAPGFWSFSNCFWRRSLPQTTTNRLLLPRLQRSRLVFRLVSNVLFLSPAVFTCSRCRATTAVATSFA